MSPLKSIVTRTKAAIFSAMVLPVLATTAALYFLVAIHEETEKVSNYLVPTVQSVTEITVLQLQQEIHLERAIAASTGQTPSNKLDDLFAINAEKFYSDEEKISRLFKETLVQLDSDKESSSGFTFDPAYYSVGNAVSGAWELHQEYAATGGQILEALERNDHGPKILLFPKTTSLAEQLDQKLTASLLEVEEATRNRAMKMEEFERSAITIIIALLSVAIIVGTIIGSVFGNRISRPLSALSHALERLNNGHIDQRIPEQKNPSDEIRVLEASVHRYRESLIAASEAQAQADQHLARFVATVETAADAIIVTDKEGRIEIFNNTAAEIFGREASTAFGAHISAVLPVQNDDGFWHDLYPSILGEQAQERLRRGIDLIVEGGCGRHIDIEMSIGVTGAEQDGSVVAVLRDVSEQKRTTLELAKKSTDLELALDREIAAHKLQKDFLSMTSHEFRTPLAIIDATAQMLMRRLSPNDESQANISKRLASIRKNVVRMTGLIDAALDVAKIDEAELTLQKSNFSLTQVCADVSARINELCGWDRVSFASSGNEIDLYGDQSLIERVVENLVTNASKYSPRDQQIDVCIEFDDSSTCVTVTDRGTTLSEADLADVFEKFYRGQNSGGTAGTGLGLYMCKRLVELHSGEIRAEKLQPPESGTLFQFRLPTNTQSEGPRADKTANAIASDRH